MAITKASERWNRPVHDVLDDRLPGDLSAFRRHELAATLNRLRSLRV